MAHRARAGSPTGIIVTIITAVTLILLCTTSGSAGVGEWTVTGGPSSQRGNVELLAVDAATEGVAYAVVEVAGLHRLYRTADQGGSWASVHAFQQAIGSLAISDTALYLGAVNVAPGQPAILRSTDTGDTWNPVYTATVTTTVNALTMAPGSTDHVYAALTTSDGGAVLETTTGASWSEVLTNAGSFEAVAVDPLDPARVFAAGNTGSEGERLAEIHRTTNGGASWTEVSPETTDMFEQFLVVHPDNPDIVFAKTRDDYCCPPPDGHLWRSTDGGDTWAQIGPERADPLDNPIGLLIIAFAPPDSIVSVDGAGWWTKDASAATPAWTQEEPALPEQFVACGAVDGRIRSASDDPLLYAGFMLEGVYTSTDRLVTMHEANEGFPTELEPHVIALDPNDENTLYTVTDQDGFKSDDGGATWTPMHLATYYDEPIYPLSFAVSPDDWQVVLMGADDRSENKASIHRSTDGGVTWTPVYSNSEAMSLSEIALGVAFDPTDPSRAYALSGAESPATPVQTVVLTSADAGISWTRAITVPGMNPGMSVLRVDPDGYVYVAGRTWDPPLATVIRSDDRGESWETVYEGGETLIRDLAFDPLYPTDVYMIDEDTLYKSIDRGESWSPILTSQKGLYSILHDPTIPERLYLGMEGPAILMSYDGGDSWLELENWEGDVLAPHVMSLAAGGDPVKRTLYAGLDGVWRYVLTGTEGNIAPSEGGTLVVSSSESTAVSARTANGTLASEDVAMTIQVPPGAVAEATRLLYMPALEPIEWLESTDMRSVGHAFTLDAYEVGGHVKDLTFGEPVTVTLHYSNADVATVDEESLVLQLWEGGDWTDAAETCSPASTYVRDLEGNSLAVPICHLSYYALAGDPQYTLSVPMVAR